MADKNTPVGDELALSPNGCIRIMLAGRGATWRRPVFGEYRKFRESLIALGDEETRLIDAISAEAREAAGTPEVPWPADKVPPYSREQRLRLEMSGAEALGGWAIDVWRVLCDKEPPTLEELPLWMMVAQFSQTVFEHWRAVPLAGSSSR